MRRSCTYSPPSRCSTKRARAAKCSPASPARRPRPSRRSWPSASRRCWRTTVRRSGRAGAAGSSWPQCRCGMRPTHWGTAVMAAVIERSHRSRDSQAAHPESGCDRRSPTELAGTRIAQPASQASPQGGRCARFRRYARARCLPLRAAGQRRSTQAGQDHRDADSGIRQQRAARQGEIESPRDRVERMLRACRAECLAGPIAAAIFAV